MKNRLLLALAAVVAVLLLAPRGQAHAQDTGLCPPQAGGVPFWSPAAPQWREFGAAPPTAACTASVTSGTGVTTDCHYDDPRWRGAAALTYTSASGSANPPVQFRTVWSNDGTGKFMYLQWITRVGIFGDPGNNHDLFFSFERPNTAGFPVDHRRAHMIKIHVAPISTAGLRNSTPTYCDPDAVTCDDTTDYYSIYVNSQIDPGGGPVPETSGCSGFAGDGLTFRARPTGEAWIDGAIQVQRLCDGTTCDLWAVSMRVPVIAANAAAADPFSGAAGGIEEGSKFWYQVDLRAASLLAMLDSWPRLANPSDPENPTCYVNAANDRYVQRDLDAATGWSEVSYWDGFSTRPASCFDGFSLTPDDVGTIIRDFGTAAPGDVITPTLGWEFKAFTGGTTRASNRVVARATNNGDVRAAGTAQLKARFRLAGWGIQPWAATGPDTAWTDIRGSTADGVCASTGAPAPSGGTCTAVAGIINNGDKVGVSFDWNIGGDDATVDVTEALEYCIYGLTPPAASGFTCIDCADPKFTRVAGTPTGSCARKLWDHQCMVVELSADSAENIETQSVYRNMNIRQMSETAREATITVRGLPPIPGAKDEEIYLVLMPRNLPASLPGVDGQDFIQQGAKEARDKLMRPYVEAAKVLTDEQIAEIEERGWGGVGYGANRFDPDVGERPNGENFPDPELPRGSRLMADGQRAAAGMLDSLSKYEVKSGELTQTTIDTLDDITATTILPTVDVYAFRKGVDKALVPMSSFSLVVYHDGPMYGIEWEIDGATKVSDNVFRVQMPTGHRKKINIRVMAKESAGDQQTKGNPKWPCSSGGGGCCGGPKCATSEQDFALRTGVPVLLVGVVLTFRRRRKRDSSK